MFGIFKRKLKKLKVCYDIYNICLIVIVKFRKFFLMIQNGEKNHDDNIPNYECALSILDKKKEKIKNEIKEKDLYNIDLDLSIIVPIYNAERYLVECLDSLKNQVTLYKYEVICIDDGSTDRSSAILEKYRYIDQFVIIYQENKGYSDARNRGIDISKGRYITFVDSDDYIATNFVESCMVAAKKSQYDIILCPYIKCNAVSKELAIYKYRKGFYSSFMDYIQFDGTPWGKIYARGLWEDVRFPEGMIFEDTIIFNVIYRMCNGIYVIDDTVYYYRIHGENTIDRIKNSQKVCDAIYCIKYCLDITMKIQLEYKVDYYAFLLLQCSTHVWYRIKNLDENMQKAIFSLLCVWVSDYKEKMTENVVFEDVVIRYLDICFKERNYRLWKTCSKIYPSNHIIVRTRYKVLNK